MPQINKLGEGILLNNHSQECQDDIIPKSEYQNVQSVVYCSLKKKYLY